MRVTFALINLDIPGIDGGVQAILSCLSFVYFYRSHSLLTKFLRSSREEKALFVGTHRFYYSELFVPYVLTCTY